MIRINLLPYREERRRNQILQYLAVAGSALGITIILLLGFYSWTSMRIADTQHRLDTIQAKDRAVRARIGELSRFKEVKAEVQKKLDLVHMLQLGRFRSLESLLGISRAVPKNVWLTSVQNRGGTINLSGYGESNRSIAAFMRALEKQRIFTGISLEVIRRELKDGVALRSFSLSMQRINPPATAGAGEKRNKSS